jgi:hypothetical protein
MIVSLFICLYKGSSGHGYNPGYFQRLIGCVYPTVLANKQPAFIRVGNDKPTNWTGSVDWTNISKKNKISAVIGRKKMLAMCRQTLVDPQNIRLYAQTFHTIIKVTLTYTSLTDKESWNNVEKMEELVRNMMPPGYPEALMVEAIVDIEETMKQQRKSKGSSGAVVKMTSFEDMDEHDIKHLGETIQSLKNRMEKLGKAKERPVRGEDKTFNLATLTSPDDSDNTWSLAISFYDKEKTPTTCMQGIDILKKDIDDTLECLSWNKGRSGFWYFIEIKIENFEYEPNKEVLSKLQDLGVCSIGICTNIQEQQSFKHYYILENSRKDSQELFRGSRHANKEIMFKRLFVDYFIRR